MILLVILFTLFRSGFCQITQCHVFGTPTAEDLFLSGPYTEISGDVQWCDDVLGCLDVSENWVSEFRRINCVPSTRERINTRFYVNTRQLLDVNTNNLISADDADTFSQIDASKPTKLIVHGFLSRGDFSWLKDMAKAFLAYGDYNVIRVDWGDGAQTLGLKAEANTRVAGLEIGHLINKLITDKGLNPADVHCLGHSLGSHICGYAGEQISGMGRISALDPAVKKFQNTQTFIRLDPSDAIFVDVISTQDHGRGIYTDFGNLNFYPNELGNQPGCDIASIIANYFATMDVEQFILYIYDCDHMRPYEYYTESIQRDSSCPWLGQECDSYESYDNGNCYSCGDDGSQCAYLGIRADEYVAKDREGVAMFLKTNGRSPFCAHQYQVSLLTGSGGRASVTGNLYITVYGENSEVINNQQLTESSEKIEHGTVKSSVFISQEDIDKATRIDLRWNYIISNIFDSSTWCFWFCDSALYVKSVQLIPLNEGDRAASKALLCGAGGSTIKINNGQTKTFATTTGCQSP